MIKVIDNDKVLVEFANSTYHLDDTASYMQLIVVLTNPDPSAAFPADAFEIDSSITNPDLLAIAERYSQFFKTFLASREKRITENNASINAGQQAIKSSIEMLNAS